MTFSAFTPAHGGVGPPVFVDVVRPLPSSVSSKMCLSKLQAESVFDLSDHAFAMVLGCTVVLDAFNKYHMQFNFLFVLILQTICSQCFVI